MDRVTTWYTNMKMYTNPKKHLQNYQNKKKQVAMQKEDGIQESSLV